MPLTSPRPHEDIQPASDDTFSTWAMLRRGALLLLVGGAVLAALIWWGGGLVVWEQIQGARPAWIAVAFLSHYLGFTVRGLRWQWILRAGGANISLGYANGLVISGWFFNSIAPARAGDLLRIAMLRYGDRQDDPVRVGTGVGAVVAERALDLLAILTLSGFFALILVDVALPSWLGLAYGAITLLLVLIICGILIAPRILAALTARWQRLQSTKLIELVDQTVSALQAVAARPMRLAGILAMSAVVWLCDAAILWAAVQALAGSSTFREAEFVALTSALAAAAPLTPGAMGQIEAAYAGLLLLVGEHPALIPAVILLSRGVSYWLFLPVAGLVTVAAGLHRFWPIVARSRAAAAILTGQRTPTSPISEETSDPVTPQPPPEGPHD